MITRTAGTRETGNYKKQSQQHTTRDEPWAVAGCVAWRGLTCNAWHPCFFSRLNSVVNQTDDWPYYNRSTFYQVASIEKPTHSKPKRYLKIVSLSPLLIKGFAGSGFGKISTSHFMGCFGSGGSVATRWISLLISSTTSWLGYRFAIFSKYSWYALLWPRLL